jgi:hypothetical protein
MNTAKIDAILLVMESTLDEMVTDWDSYSDMINDSERHTTEVA